MSYLKLIKIINKFSGAYISFQDTFTLESYKPDPVENHISTNT